MDSIHSLRTGDFLDGIVQQSVVPGILEGQPIVPASRLQICQGLIGAATHIQIFSLQSPLEIISGGICLLMMPGYYPQSVERDGIILPHP